jgi:hypothetical protein
MILHTLLASLLVNAQASSYYIKPFSEFTEEAAAVVHGTVSNIHTENDVTDNGAKIIYTYATLDVKEVLKGPIHTRSILIREIGGTKDGYTVDIPGSPELKEGEDTVLFLGTQNAKDQSFEITGLELGKYSLEEKNGQSTLKGGIFNYTTPSDHTAGDAQAENQHPWTLKDLRTLIEKQGGKNAPPKASSTPQVTAGSGNAKAGVTTAASNSALAPTQSKITTSQTLSTSETGGFSVSFYVALAIAVVAGFFFLFRKR